MANIWEVVGRVGVADALKGALDLLFLCKLLWLLLLGGSGTLLVSQWLRLDIDKVHG